MGLLDYLRITCDKDYISDLRYAIECVDAVKKLDCENYSINDWNDAIEYLCYVKTDFESKVEAQEYLLKHFSVVQ